MDEGGEAIEGRRGVSLKRMLGAYSRHCTSHPSINKEEFVCRCSGIGRGIALHGFRLKRTWDDSMVDL